VKADSFMAWYGVEAPARVANVVGRRGGASPAPTCNGRGKARFV
jgi:hypothetical protein